jgi:serine/threonine-protein kinase
MAPEQATEKLVDERTDIYNFGATMYRLVTKQYANLGIPSVGDGGLSKKIRPRPPIELVPEIPGTLNETIVACLHPRPEGRPAGMFEVKHQLDAVARHLGLAEDDLKGSEDLAQ